MRDIKATLKQIIHDLYGLDFEPDLTPSPDNIDADYSSNAPLKLAKELHENPMAIAEKLANSAFEEHIWRRAKYGATEPLDRRRSRADEALALRVEATPDGRPDRVDGSEGAFRKSTIASISAPGFLNFTLSDDYLSDSIDVFDTDISSEQYKGQTVICEFSDPNPFKVLHVGHLYTSVVGDSIARLFEYAGAKVIRANFGGDVGLHVAKTMYALQQKSINNLTIEDIAKCYVEGTAAYEDDEKAHQKITELNKEIYAINAAGPLHGRVTALGGPTFELDENRGKVPAGPAQNTSGRTNGLAKLYWRGRELSYHYFDQFYNSIGVHFDKYYPESTVADLGLAKVKEQLQKGVYEYSDGAVIFDGDKYGLHTRVFINKEGVPTYETKDVGLIFTKWQDYHFDKSVVITGSEQLDYMKVVLTSVKQYAPELVEKTTHLTHGLVKLPGGVKMSSRKGNFLKAVDVLDMVRAALKQEHNSEDETVSLAATKYAFLKYKMGGNIIFDPEESVKMTGNSGPYLLYSCVRAKRILDKNLAQNEGLETVSREGGCPSEESESREDGRERTGSKNLHSSERGLIKKLLEYRAVLDEAVTEMAPHKVANYLYELAQAFSRFYENCEVLGSNQEERRLRLVKTYLDTMTHGLGLLGIEIPESM